MTASSLNLASFARTQTILSRYIEEREFQEPRLVAGVDVSYGRNAYAACVVCDGDMRVVEEHCAESPIRFPYIPTFFSFREFPPIMNVVRDTRYDVLFVHGHGLAHPRRFGLACHVGLLTQRPTIGIARGLICGSQEGDRVECDGQVVGKIFSGHVVSVGNLATLSQAYECARRFWREGLPFPLQKAHHLAERFKNNRI